MQSNGCPCCYVVSVGRLERARNVADKWWGAYLSGLDAPRRIQAQRSVLVFRFDCSKTFRHYPDGALTRQNEWHCPEAADLMYVGV